MSSLTIISHTEHYKNPDGTIVGLGPTVTEINHLLDVFDDITHVAMLHDIIPPPSALPYVSNKITFIPLPAVGGPTISNKLAIFWRAPRILKIIQNSLKKSDYFQFRAPTGIGVFVIPYLVLLSSKKGWFKYAGNWNQKQAPIAYRIQKWLLKHQNRKVTINGQWSDQPKHCFTFENPCLTDTEIQKGQRIIKDKSLKAGFINFCFVGRLEEEKGVDLLIHAFKKLTVEEKSMINSIHIVGDGKSKSTYIEMAKESGLNFVFHGLLSRSDVQNIYKESHAIVLPSASEGFPKVIAEAMNFGCLPVVSDVSSIGHYIKNNDNGFLLKEITEDGLLQELQNVLMLQPDDYLNMIHVKKEDVNRFTYSYYNKRIINEILE